MLVVSEEILYDGLLCCVVLSCRLPALCRLGPGWFLSTLDKLCGRKPSTLVIKAEGPSSF